MKKFFGRWALFVGLAVIAFGLIDLTTLLTAGSNKLDAPVEPYNLVRAVGLICLGLISFFGGIRLLLSKVKNDALQKETHVRYNYLIDLNKRGVLTDEQLELEEQYLLKKK